MDEVLAVSTSLSHEDEGINLYLGTTAEDPVLQTGQSEKFLWYQNEMLD